MYTCSLERMKDKIKTFSAFGDAGRSTRNIVGMFWRKKLASRIVPSEIDSVGSAGSCTRRNPTLFSRNARRRFE